MPPFQLLNDAFDKRLPIGSFSMQWQNPGDVFSVLLLLGGDVISRAIAQLAGTHAFAPVAFSFGWVAFSVNALLSAVGENKLMPAPDISCLVINGRSGYARNNCSWLIARLVRDFEHWMPDQTRAHLQTMLDRRWEENKAAAAREHAPHPHEKSTLPSPAPTLPFGSSTVPRPTRASLCVTVLAASASAAPHPAPPARDRVYLSGFATQIVQLAIAAAPCAAHGDWGVLAVTALGMALAAATGALPQWAREKWACRRGSSKAVVLTRGNGAQHALIVLGEGRGLDLEDLAAGPANLDLATAGGRTVAAVVALSAAWIALLVAAAGLRVHSWYLVAAGAVGMLQNIYVAGARRRPEAVGVPLEFREVLGEAKVFETLLEVERRYPRLGRSMLDTFFPGGHLTEEEEARWKTVEANTQTGEDFAQ